MQWPPKYIFYNKQSAHSCHFNDLCDILMFLLCFFLVAGLQAILPEYLRARFVQAALSYIGCNEEGQFVCRDNDCWCQCAIDFPHCNCPEVDLRALEASLLKIRDSWNTANQDFEESGQFYLFFFFLPSFKVRDHPSDSKIDPVVTMAVGQR